jgi:hypothetical protein
MVEIVGQTQRASHSSESCTISLFLGGFSECLLFCLLLLLKQGTKDPLLPFAIAMLLKDFLEKSGAEVDFIRFDDGHTIPPQAMQKYVNFVLQLSKQSPM